jgi:hypothetical protein
MQLGRNMGISSYKFEEICDALIAEVDQLVKEWAIRLVNSCTHDVERLIEELFKEISVPMIKQVLNGLENTDKKEWCIEILSCKRVVNKLKKEMQ